MEHRSSKYFGKSVVLTVLMILGSAAIAQGKADTLREEASIHQIRLGDLAGAQLLYEQSCMAGSAASCNDTGDFYRGIYLKNRGIKIDRARADHFYKMACDGGSALACATIQRLSAPAPGRAKTNRLPTHQRTSATPLSSVSSGHRKTSRTGFVCSSIDWANITYEEAKAAKLRLNDPSCSYIVGRAAASDDDYNTALRYYRMAAAQNYPYAMISIGTYYNNQTDNYDLALKWYKRALPLLEKLRDREYLEFTNDLIQTTQGNMDRLTERSGVRPKTCIPVPDGNGNYRGEEYCQ